MKEFLFGTRGDMVVRGVITLVFVTAAGMYMWVSAILRAVVFL